MLHAKHLPYHLWAKAMNTSCHVHNRVTLRAGTSTTLYVFGNKSYILGDRDYIRKMDPKSDE